jgi:hypothetical protein
MSQLAEHAAEPFSGIGTWKKAVEQKVRSRRDEFSTSLMIGIAPSLVLRASSSAIPGFAFPSAAS